MVSSLASLALDEKFTKLTLKLRRLQVQQGLLELQVKQIERAQRFVSAYLFALDCDPRLDLDRSDPARCAVYVTWGEMGESLAVSVRRDLTVRARFTRPGKFAEIVSNQFGWLSDEDAETIHRWASELQGAYGGASLVEVVNG